MKHRIVIAMCCGMLLLSGGCATMQHPKNCNDPQLNAVAWLAGSWSSENGNRISEEHWTQPRGGTMFGTNRAIANGKTVFFEYLRIEHRPDGVYYLASPNGRNPPTAFKMIESGANTVTFENPEHDFPQRIIYRREGGTLHGRIEGKQNDQPASDDWTWRRVK